MGIGGGYLDPGQTAPYPAMDVGSIIIRSLSAKTLIGARNFLLGNRRMGMEIDHLEKRFGVIAIEKGFLSADQVIEALRIQVLEDIEKGGHRLMGRILLEKGQITLSQINEVLTSLGKNLPLLREE
jgi:hypothetical protein